jgi:DNA-binding beta-propeller fold protein YncE
LRISFLKTTRFNPAPIGFSLSLRVFAAGISNFFPFDSTPVIEINNVRLSLGPIPRGGFLVSFQKRCIGVASYWRSIQERSTKMKKFSVFAALVSLIIASHSEARASEEIIVKRDAAERFARLPDGVRFPEGITANPKTEEIYVATFDFGPNSNKLLRFNKYGQLVAQRDFGVTPLLGLQFNSWDKKIYIANVGALVGGASKIQRIAADFNDTTPIEDVALIPSIGPPPDRAVGNPDGSQDTIMFGNNAPAPNALTFDRHGNLYVSDSFQGAVFRIDNAHKCTAPCPVATAKHDALLATAGFPPFGANGLALSRDGNKLYIANTGDDRILLLDLKTEKLSIWAESINGADGIAFYRGRLVVAANQADEVVILNENGRVIAKLGDFLGIRSDGSPRGLLFPASVVIVDDKIFVTNLALPLTMTEGDEPEEDVTKYTVSRIDIPNHLP